MRTLYLIPVACLLAFTTPAMAIEILPLDFILTEGDADDSIPCCERPAGREDTPPATAAPTLTVSASVESRALFTDQAFTASTRPTAVLNATLSTGGWSLDLWHREPLTGHACDRETDYSLIRSDTLGSTVITGKVAYIAICGRDAYQARLRARHPLGNGFSVEVGGDLIRGGFVDNVARVQLAYSRELRPNSWSVSPSATLAYSSFNRGLSLAGEFRVGRPIGHGLRFEAYATGYVSHRSDFALGATISQTFSFGQ